MGALGMLTMLVGFQPAHGQSYTAYDVKPTVTTNMGELGGKYFGQTPDPAKTHRYYIAAEPVQWDFMPIGSDPICGMTPPANVTAWHRVRKVRYFQYTDGTFTERVPQSPRLGILGPVLRGVIGDYIEITFLNRTALPLSLHPHGVKYDKDSEGSYYGDNRDSKSLPDQNGKEGRSAPRPWRLALSAPGPVQLCLGTSMRSPVRCPRNPVPKAGFITATSAAKGRSILGLEGFIIVTDPKRARPDGTPERRGPGNARAIHDL